MRNAAPCTGFSCEILDMRPGLLSFQVEGKDSSRIFAKEPGGHRWQRVPPTEKRGRRHTSTVTVAVLELPADLRSTIPESEIEWKATRGSGAGGQHRNVTDSAIQMKHVPTGISVRIETERSQNQNRDLARRVLEARVAESQKTAQLFAQNGARRAQVGSGMRGDKIRTIRLQDGVVVDHQTGRRTSTTKYLRGDFSELV